MAEEIPLFKSILGAACCEIYSFCWLSFLQRDALKNEKGLTDNPLQISWLGAMASANDAAAAGTQVSGSCKPTKADAVESKVMKSYST